MKATYIKEKLWNIQGKIYNRLVIGYSNSLLLIYERLKKVSRYIKN